MLVWSQSYDRELQRQRCEKIYISSAVKIYNAKKPTWCVLKTKIFPSTLKNAPAYHNAGVVIVNSAVVGFSIFPNLVYLDHEKSVNPDRQVIMTNGKRGPL
jgi:hypothetical protein